MDKLRVYCLKTLNKLSIYPLGDTPSAPSGCHAWVHMPKDQQKKWDTNSQPMIFVGYESGSKAFRLWNLKTCSIVISASVHFDEKNFPRKLAQAPPPIAPSPPTDEHVHIPSVLNENTVPPIQPVTMLPTPALTPSKIPLPESTPCTPPPSPPPSTPSSPSPSQPPPMSENETSSENGPLLCLDSEGIRMWPRRGRGERKQVRW